MGRLLSLVSDRAGLLLTRTNWVNVVLCTSRVLFGPVFIASLPSVGLIRNELVTMGLGSP
jgi:hypothetical protein